jgi:short-subunit dehydrogenase
MKRWSGKWCLITGAASGIGRETAILFAAQGARLVLCDVRRAEVDVLGSELRASGIEVITYGADVSDLNAMSVFASWVTSRVGALDVLVNNAGILLPGGYQETDFDAWRRTFDVNFWGAVHAVKLLAPKMVERGEGAIVNVASISGRVGFSKLTAYSSSKFALIGFSQALRAELMGSGVSVSAVCPAFVKTPIADNAPISDAARQAANAVLNQHGIAPERVARAIESAARKGTSLVHVGFEAHLLSAAACIAPGLSSSWLAKFAK